MLNAPSTINTAPMTTRSVEPLNRNIWMRARMISITPMLMFILAAAIPRVCGSSERRDLKLKKTEPTQLMIKMA
ncbi:hypothetical protein HMSSN139_22200 [Paenibacillus sp. HMSSN-139]|nr:hypothetical protein HMSSN139_22200 [Paenibacillus sp. HMSSN-139]